MNVFCVENKNFYFCLLYEITDSLRFTTDYKKNLLSSVVWKIISDQNNVRTSGIALCIKTIAYYCI